MRKQLVAGNWKMNVLPSEVKGFINELKQKVQGKTVICVPFIHLQEAINECAGTNIKVGAQNMHYEAKGAYTGEVSPEMLKDLGVQYVIIGHSERRQYFAETDDTVNLKLKAAFRVGLNPIMCIGETLEQREAGVTNKVLEQQITNGVAGLSENEMKSTVIAYEPIWAIGTGKTATPEDAESACKFIRSVIAKLYNEEVANEVTIQYGGSVKSSNSKELFAMQDIDGGLIGGASLKADDFSAIVSSTKA